MMKTLQKNNRVIKALLFVLIFFTIGTLKAQEIEWTWQNPFPSGNSHYDVAWIDDQTIYVSGSKGQFLKSLDFGGTWEASQIPTVAPVRAISFRNINEGYAVTDNGEIFYTQNAGDTWDLQFTDTSAPTLRDIDFFDDNLGYAVGDAGYIENVLFRTTDGGENWEAPEGLIKTQNGGMVYVNALNADTVVSVGFDNIFFYSYDAGINWDTTHLPVPPAGYYEGAYFVNDSVGYAVAPNSFVSKTTDFGKSWDVKLGSADSIDDQSHYFTQVFFLNENTGWVSSFGCLYKTNDGGDSWERACEGTYGSARKSHISFNDENKGIVVAPFEIYTTTDAITFNEILPTDPINSWYSIDEAEGELFVAGNEGKIFHSTNDGIDWSIMSTPVTSGLRGISFLDKNIGWAVGSDSVILKTNDGGVSWEAFDTDFAGSFSSIYAWSSSHAIVAGNSGAIFKTTNGGEDWVKGLIESENSINAIHFPNVDTGYVVGRSGLTAITTNGGLNWEIQDAGVLSHLNDVFFIDGSIGYAVGNSGKILYTENSGGTWLPQVSNQSSTLYSVFFYDENFGYATGRGFVLVTDDGGETWIEQNTPSSNALNDVIFIAPDKGWAVGTNGTVLYFGEEIDEVTGIFSQFQNTILTAKVFPNPAHYQTTFALPSNYNGAGKLKVFNVLGRLVYTSDLLFESGKSQWIISPGLGDGIYSFQLMTGKETRGGKLLIRR